jgi:hypothetical protein
MVSVKIKKNILKDIKKAISNQQSAISLID